MGNGEWGMGKKSEQLPINTFLKTFPGRAEERGGRLETELKNEKFALPKPR
jgi:hypothetical protein